MTSITFSDLLRIIFVIVDDCYKTNGIQYLKGKPERHFCLKLAI